MCRAIWAFNGCTYHNVGNLMSWLIYPRYKARLIANSSSCTTTELSKLLTSCLTAVKTCYQVCEKVYERSGKNLFWSTKISGEILDKIEARDFNTNSLSPMIFLLFTLFTSYFFKINLLILLKEPSTENALITLLVMTGMHFYFRKTKKYHAWSCQNACDALTFCKTFYLIWHQVA